MGTILLLVIGFCGAMVYRCIVALRLYRKLGQEWDAEKSRYYQDLRDIDCQMAAEMAKHREIMRQIAPQEPIEKIDNFASDLARLNITQQRLERMEKFSAYADEFDRRLDEIRDWARGRRLFLKLETN